jgi:hypothetical protein
MTDLAEAEGFPHEILDEPAPRVRIKRGAILFHDHWFVRWGEDDTVFDLEKRGKSYSLTAHGYGKFGTRDSYGSGGFLTRNRRDLVDVDD